MDLDRLCALARPIGSLPASPQTCGHQLAPLGQRIAVARDPAFAFAYQAALGAWRAAGASVAFFSPLADEAPPPGCDAVYLPGGYPELHAARLSASATFRAGLRDAALRGAFIYGECGGYMVLGEALIDAAGNRHPMAGLLPLVTDFARRKLHLGYRRVRATVDTPLGARDAPYRGHEFHYATVASEGPGTALFRAADAAGRDLGATGLIAAHGAGRVAGSFVHLIDQADEARP
jgi:cobyrinic acid a,c-diamide synthase